MKNTNEKSIIVFRSRSHTLKFYDYISRNGIRSEIINTPSKLQLGCGLSVKFYRSDKKYIEMAAKYLDLCSYAGIFQI